MASTAPPADGAAAFDREHYPAGLNSNFLTGSAAELGETFGNGKGKFEDAETRDIARFVPELVALLKGLGLKEGATALDLGAGTGIFLRPMAEAVGAGGKVIAAEISPGFGEILREKCAKDELLAATVQVVVSPEDKLELPDAAADIVFVCDVYHHLTFPKAIMRECLRVVKPGGVLVCIDFHRDSARITSHPAGWVEAHVRGDQATFRGEIIESGWVFDSEPEVPLKENYCMVFKRPVASE